MNTATNTNDINNQIAELTARKAELEQIAADAKREAEKTARNVQRIEDNKAQQLAVADKACTLVNADDEGRLNTTFKLDLETGVNVPTVTFTLNGREQEVEIESHLVYSSTRSYSRGPKNNGIKFRLTGGYNDYAKRYYKTAKSVLKKIAEYQEIALAVKSREITESNRHAVALSMLTSMYPDAAVMQSQEWVNTYGGRGRGYERTIFVVKGQHGTVNFKQSVKDGDTIVIVDKIVPSTEYVDTMADQILLG